MFNRITGVSFVLLAILFAQLGLASEGEALGHFRFQEFSVSPRLSLYEPKRGGFELKETWLGFEWRRDESLSASFGFGSSDLVSPAIFFNPRAQSLEFVEANVRAETAFANVRVGLIPVPFGYEGAFPEWEWVLPSSRVRNQSWLTKRDFGLELFFQTDEFSTRLMAHNGEGMSNLDNHAWYTGQWAYRNSSGVGILFSATTGGTGAESTSKSEAANADYGFPFLPNESAKIRILSASVYRKWLRSFILAEGGRGEILQNEDKNAFGWGRIDLAWHLGGDLNFLTRVEQTQTNLAKAETIVRSTSLGLAISSADRLSSISFFATKNQENEEKQNDELLLLFRLNSNTLP